MNEEKEKTISQPLAPEDIRAGDFVSLLQVVSEVLPFFFMEDVQYRKVETVKITHLPHSTRPLEVVEVCLPFVLVKGTDGKHETLDVRRHRLARLSQRYGKKAFKRFKAQGVARTESASEAC